MSKPNVATALLTLTMRNVREEVLQWHTMNTYDARVALPWTVKRLKRKTGGIPASPPVKLNITAILFHP